MSMKIYAPYSLCLLSVISASSVFAETNFGSPDTVDNTIKENQRQKQSWRDDLAKQKNLTFGLDYQVLALHANNPQSGGDNNASSGVARFYGSWDLIGIDSNNTGGFVWKIEHRHAYSDLSPKEFSFIGNGVGYAGMIGPAYSDQGTRLTNLYWKQKLNDGKTSFMVGFLDTTDYVDVYALASPWTGFSNLAFSTGGGAIGLPDDGILGIAAGHMLNENLYVVAGLADGKGDSSEPMEGFDTLFNDHRLFSSFELGWTSSQEQIYTDNIHVTFWNLDGDTRHSNSAKQEGGQGVNFSASYFATPMIMPFLRGGISDGDVALYEKSLTAGVGYFGLLSDKNTLGFAVNWSEVNEDLSDAFRVNQSDQITSEIYYHIAVNEFFQITPDLQYIKDPAFSDESSTWIVGLRARIVI